MIAPTPDNANLVPLEDACPNCGERDTDMLVWLDPPDDERVECQRCKAVYSPGGPRDEH